jgi:mercuric reductase
VSRKEGVISIEALQNDARRSYQAEALLLATGRRPNTVGLGLERAGVQVGNKGEIMVNAEMQTTAPHIWAAGDVLGEPMLETVAAKEGAIAGVNALSSIKRRMDFSAVPHAIFTMPQLASVGLTGRQAMERGRACRFSTVSMTQVPRAKIGNDTRGLVNMVIDADTEEIVGVHILASQAAEMIHEGVLAVRLHLKLNDITDTVHVYPTMTEAMKMVAQAFRKGMERTCCTE